MMRILVTGASGFVGSAACTHLEELGHEVLRWLGPGRSDDGNSKTFSVEIADESTFPQPKAIGHLDAVVHCAGIAHRFGRVSREEFDRVNVRGVENAARFAERVGARKFVLLSSVLVYGQQRNDEPVTEEFATAPADDYGRSKLAGEEAARRMCRSAGIKLVILRLVPIIGEGSRGNVSRLIRAIDRGRFMCVGDGRNRRSFVYVGDVAKAIGRLLDIEGDITILNVSGDAISIKRLVERIAARLCRKIPKLMVPASAATGMYYGLAIVSLIPVIERSRRTLETWLADAVYSGDKFHDICGLGPLTSIEEAIDREVDHYLQTR